MKLPVLATWLAASLATGPNSQEAASPGDARFEESVLQAPDEGVLFALRDFSGNGRSDLLRVDERGLTVYAMGAEGRLASEGKTLAWPAPRVAWDLSDFDGDGSPELVLLVDGSTVRVHPVGEDGAIGEGRDLFQVESTLPAGVHRIHFARDVDGDGRQDLVLPGSGVHRIYLANEDSFAAPIEVAYDVDLSVDVGDPESLSGSFGQEVSIPWFRLRDVDGDGRRDLVSTTEDRVAFHLAQPELSTEPTWVLDLEQLRAELPDQSDIDFDNLLSAVENRVSWRIADLDGKGAHDLVVVLGAKFRVYLDGARTGPEGAPDQVLKSSGNVLWSHVRQIAGDELPDLQILRGERISVGRVLRTLILPGSLSFDAFTYENQGGTFTRKPTRRNRITIEIPRLLSFMDEAEGMGDALEEQLKVPTKRLAREPGVPAEGDDVVDVLDGELVIFEGKAPGPTFGESFESEGHIQDDLEQLLVRLLLEDLDARGDGAERTFDLGELAQQDFAPGAILRKACLGTRPVARHPLVSKTEEVTELLTHDLDGDGTLDVIVVGLHQGVWTLQFLVRR